MVPPGIYITIMEKEGGVERKTNLTLPSYVWVVGGGPLATWPNVPEGETVAAFLCLFGMSDPPPPRFWDGRQGLKH